MYTKQDYDDLSAQLKKRLLLLAVPAALLLAGLVYSLVIRMQWLTVGLTLVLGCMIIFCYLMFISPIRYYRAHVQHALYGKVRQLEGCLKEMEETALWREGLLLWPMIININDMENEEDDRLFYYDARLPRPQWEKGTRLFITSYDKLVTCWEEK